jgi:hypothetical protein
MTPSGIEPATFWFVGQCLKNQILQRRMVGRPLNIIIIIIIIITKVL